MVSNSNLNISAPGMMFPLLILVLAMLGGARGASERDQYAQQMAPIVKAPKGHQDHIDLDQYVVGITRVRMSCHPGSRMLPSLSVPGSEKAVTIQTECFRFDLRFPVVDLHDRTAGQECSSQDQVISSTPWRTSFPGKPIGRGWCDRCGWKAS